MSGAWILLAFVSAVPLILAVLLGIVFHEGRLLGQELMKALLQVAVVGVLGVVAKMVADDYQSRRDREEAIHESKRNLLKDLIQAFSAIKQIRVRLRAANCLGAPDQAVTASMRESYESLLTGLSEEQLNLELIKGQVDTNSIPFADEAKTPLVKCLESMERYLSRGAVEEFEQTMPRLQTGQPWPPMPNLSDLVGHKSQKYHQEFLGPFREALQLIQADLLGSEVEPVGLRTVGT